MSKLVLTEEQIQALPTDSKLVGFAINRTVYFNGTLLGDPENFPRYDWGYYGEDCKRLAHTFLAQFLSPKTAEKWANTFLYHIVSKLSLPFPELQEVSEVVENEKVIELEVLKKKSLNATGNFSVEIDMQGYIRQLVSDCAPSFPEGLDEETTPIEWTWIANFVKEVPLEREEVKLEMNDASFVQLEDHKKGSNPLL